MSWGALLVNLGVTAVTVAVLMLATFAYAMRTRVHAIMDTVWALLRRNTGSPARFVLRYIYWAQGRVMWFVSLPLQVAMYERASVSFVTWLGVAVWLFGFAFRRLGGVVRAVAAGLLALARSGRGRVAGVHDEHAGAAHRQAAAGKAHGPFQGGRVRRLCSPDQRVLPVAAASTWGWRLIRSLPCRGGRRGAGHMPRTVDAAPCRPGARVR